MRSRWSTKQWGAALVVVASLATLVWWWLPWFRGDGDHTDVVFVGDGFMWDAQQELTRRTHEDGFAVVWAPRTDTWCDAPATVAALVQRERPSRVVVSFDAEGTCGIDPSTLRRQVADAAGAARLVVLENPDASAPPVAVPGATVVDAAQLLGPAGTPDQGCQWWDSGRCRPDGRIEVRESDGSLALSGQTRVARLVVAALR